MLKREPTFCKTEGTFDVSPWKKSWGFPSHPPDHPYFFTSWAGSVFVSPSLSLCAFYTWPTAPAPKVWQLRDAPVFWPDHDGYWYWSSWSGQTRWDGINSNGSSGPVLPSAGCASNQAFDLVLEPSSSQGNSLLVHGGTPCPASHQAFSSSRDFPSRPCHNTGCSREV